MEKLKIIYLDWHFNIIMNINMLIDFYKDQLKNMVKELNDLINKNHIICNHGCESCNICKNKLDQIKSNKGDINILMNNFFSLISFTLYLKQTKKSVDEMMWDDTCTENEMTNLSENICKGINRQAEILYREIRENME